MTFGDKLKQVIKRSGHNQSDFAEVIEESFSTLNKVLNNHRPPTFELILKVVSIQPDIDLNWLIRDDAPSSNDLNEPTLNYKKSAEVNKIMAAIDKNVNTLRAVLTQI
mgnify:CR=1 FL=1